MCEVGLEARPRENLFPNRLHQLDADLFDRPTLTAHEMLMVDTGRGVVLPDGMAEMRVAHESDVLEKLEVPVHGREVHAPEPLTDAFVDLFRGQMLSCAVDGLEDQLPLGCDAVPARAHLGKELVYGR